MKFLFVNARLAQLAEASVLETERSRFESGGGYQLLRHNAPVVQLAGDTRFKPSTVWVRIPPGVPVENSVIGV